MKYVIIFPYYLAWHYGRGLIHFLIFIKNLIVFIPQYFSIGELFKTLFSPIFRLRENYEKEFSLSILMEVFIFNLIMRTVGFICRIFVIIIGLILTMFTIVLCCSFFILWLILPFLILFIFISSIVGLYKYI